MIRVCRLVFCAVMVCSCLTGCQSRKTPVPDTQLKPVQDLVESSVETWDLHEEDCRKSDQYKKEINPVGTKSVYTASEPVILLKEKCKQSYSFEGNNLAFVQFLFPDSEGNSLTKYNTIAENFTNHYGEGKAGVNTKGTQLPQDFVELEGYWDIDKYRSNKTMFFFTQWTSHGKILSLCGVFSPNNDTVLQRIFIQVRNAAG